MEFDQSKAAANCLVSTDRFCFFVRYNMQDTALFCARSMSSGDKRVGAKACVTRWVVEALMAEN